MIYGTRQEQQSTAILGSSLTPDGSSNLTDSLNRQQQQDHQKQSVGMPAIVEGQDNTEHTTEMTAMRNGAESVDRGSNTGGGAIRISAALKFFLLIVLCLQNAVYAMLRRYSVGVLHETYSASSVLLVGEIIKLVVSIFMTLADSGASSAQGSGLKKLWWLVLASAPMAVPAVVFWLMNLLSYVSLQRIDASTFTVCAQMKILTTAVFSKILMKKRFHARKWRALVLLVLGVTLVSSGSYEPKGEDEQAANEFGAQYIIGIAAVLTEVTLSGFVSVFFEKVLKSRVVKLSVWDRNFQLATYSIVLYVIVALQEEGPMFKGWSKNAVVLAILGSAGGLLVAFTMKYTDAVLKTFATSGAIIVCAVAGYALVDAPLDIPIMIGAMCTVLSLLNYSDEGEPLASATGSCEKDREGGGGGAGGVRGWQTQLEPEILRHDLPSSIGEEASDPLLERTESMPKQPITV